ncbi:MAG: alkaline shock response membrane anchor protein AmaP [Candidatus Omnitrophica bacterium]|nr:alkaline shock response membrane anchor protein AmaP [Candidatus Omnitrophota bacterium]
MRTLGILFYTAILVCIGIFLVAFAVIFSFGPLQPVSLSYINNFLNYAQENINARIVIGLCGFLLTLISVSFAQLILGRFQREKNIAFNTSSGEVTIALSAIEDLIRRLAGIMPEIKELRPDVIASKKGITVDLRVVLKSDANIPELTARLQELTRGKIQEVLGIEENIIIRIHVTKIISIDEKKRKETAREDSPIPFSEYRRL